MTISIFLCRTTQSSSACLQVPKVELLNPKKTCLLMKMIRSRPTPSLKAKKKKKKPKRKKKKAME